MVSFIFMDFGFDFLLPLFTLCFDVDEVNVVGCAASPSTSPVVGEILSLKKEQMVMMMPWRIPHGKTDSFVCLCIFPETDSRELPGAKIYNSLQKNIQPGSKSDRNHSSFFPQH